MIVLVLCGWDTCRSNIARRRGTVMCGEAELEKDALLMDEEGGKEFAGFYD